MESTTSRVRYCPCCMSSLPQEGGLCPHCGADEKNISNDVSQLRVNSILSGRYLVGRALGQGGFGVTYIGLDLKLELRVAIKEYFPLGCAVRDQTEGSRIRTLSADNVGFFQKGRDGFLKEARTLALFSDVPGVVKVRDFFEENGTAYIVMDYVEGKTLKTMAKEQGGRLPAETVLNYLYPVMDALEKIHAEGLLHRDIAPDNIMIRAKDDCALLLDFGAARLMSQDGNRSSTVNVKHGYAPEEQYRLHGEHGPWTDIYALCATIYHLTTGVLLPQAVDRLINDQPLTLPNELGAGLTAAQEAAVIKGLSVHGADRQQSMTELLAGLRSGKMTAWPKKSPAKKKTQQSVWRKCSEPIRLQIKPYALIALGLLAMLLAVGVGLILQSRSKPADVPSAPAPVVVHGSVPTAITAPQTPAMTIPTPTPAPTPTETPYVRRPGPDDLMYASNKLERPSSYLSEYVTLYIPKSNNALHAINMFYWPTEREGEKRFSYIEKGEYVTALAHEGTRYLVITEDGRIGWVNDSKVTDKLP